MVETLKRFSGLEHRCQRVATINKVDWYNDSKATNVGACIASIKGLCDLGNIILIAGGDSKGADLSSLNPIIKQYVKHVLLLGADAKKIADAIGSEVMHEFVIDMNEAVNIASDLAEAGDVVLLAPACASLDMYENYQQRGDAFVAAVNSIGGVLMSAVYKQQATVPSHYHVKNKLIAGYDLWLMGISLLILCIGLVMVASASISISAKEFNDPLHYFWRQGIAATMGLSFAFDNFENPNAILGSSSVCLY